MKSIRQIREEYDSLIGKSDKDIQKLLELAKSGLLDESNVALIDRAMKMDPSLMTIAEKKAMTDLLESLMAQVLYNETSYGVLSEDINKDEDDDKDDRKSKHDPTATKNIPMILIFKRQSIRSFPDNQSVALYYSPVMDKYVSIAFGPSGKDKKNKIVVTESRRKNNFNPNALGPGWKKLHDINQQDTETDTKREILDKTPNNRLHLIPGKAAGDEAAKRIKDLGGGITTQMAAKLGMDIHQLIRNPKGAMGIGDKKKAPKGAFGKFLDRFKSRPKSVIPSAMQTPKKTATATNTTQTSGKTAPAANQPDIEAIKAANRAKYMENQKAAADAEEKRIGRHSDEFAKQQARSTADLNARNKKVSPVMPGFPPKSKAKSTSPQRSIGAPYAPDQPKKSGFIPGRERLAESFVSKLMYMREDLKTFGRVKKMPTLPKKKNGFSWNEYMAKKHLENQNKPRTQYPSQSTAMDSPQPAPTSVAPKVDNTVARSVAPDIPYARSWNRMSGLGPGGGRLRGAPRSAESQQNEESNLEKLRMIAEGTPYDIQFGKKVIPIDDKIAKKVLTVYESLNTENKQKMEAMLDESYKSFSKAISFSIKV